MFNNWHSGGGALIGSGGQLGDTPTVADSKLALSVEERITHLAVRSRALSTGSSTRQYITHEQKLFGVATMSKACGVWYNHIFV